MQRRMEGEGEGQGEGGRGGAGDGTGSECVRVGRVGAAVELAGASDTEYVGFVWRSSTQLAPSLLYSFL